MRDRAGCPRRGRFTGTGDAAAAGGPEVRRKEGGAGVQSGGGTASSDSKDAGGGPEVAEGSGLPASVGGAEGTFEGDRAGVSCSAGAAELGDGARFGIGPVDAVLVLDEDLAGGASARKELNDALQRLLTVPILAATTGGGMGVGGDGRAAAGGVVGGRVVTVVRFLMEGTLEAVCSEEEAGLGGLEVRWMSLLLLFTVVVMIHCYWCCRDPDFTGVHTLHVLQHYTLRYVLAET